MTELDPLRIHQYQKLKEKYEADPASVSDRELEEIRLVELTLGADTEETVKKVESERLLGFVAAGVGLLLLNTPILGVPLMLGGVYLISGFANPKLLPPEDDEGDTK